MTSDPVEARTLGELLKALGNSIAHPQKHPSKKSATTQSVKKNASPSPSPNSASPAPIEKSKRATTAAPDAKGKKRDVPYAIPVPNKPGFVTSPFSPNGGYVDVRGFPSGTEVKDPYTGKIFLTP